MQCSECVRTTHARGLCRACYDKQLKSENPEYDSRQRAQSAAWRARNPDRVAAHQDRRRAKERSDGFHADRHTKRIAKRFGVSVDFINQARARGCTICGKHGRLHVDHDHATGAYRGVLCHSCNIGLGFVERPDEWLARACAYLRRAQGD